jgi:hypothetical protein
VGLNSLKSLNLTNVYPNNNNKNNNKVKSKPLELRSRVKICYRTIITKYLGCQVVESSQVSLLRMVSSAVSSSAQGGLIAISLS